MAKTTNFSFDTKDRYYQDYKEFDFEEFNNPFDEDAYEHSSEYYLYSDTRTILDYPETVCPHCHGTGKLWMPDENHYEPCICTYPEE